MIIRIARWYRKCYSCRWESLSYGQTKMAFNPSDLWCLLIFPGEKMYHLRSIMRACKTLVCLYLPRYIHTTEIVFAKRARAIMIYWSPAGLTLSYRLVTTWLQLGCYHLATTEEMYQKRGNVLLPPTTWTQYNATRLSLATTTTWPPLKRCKK
jgi:hypothetical protein